MNERIPRNEAFSDAHQRISRPRQLYVGVPRREFVSLADRAKAAGEPPPAKDKGGYRAGAPVPPNVSGRGVACAPRL